MLLGCKGTISELTSHFFRDAELLKRANVLILLVTTLGRFTLSLSSLNTLHKRERERDKKIK